MASPKLMFEYAQSALIDAPSGQRGTGNMLLVPAVNGTF